MLFDLRWINEDGVSFMPDENQITEHAYVTLGKAIINGRILGASELRDRGFIASYLQVNGNEVARISYVLSEANSLK